MMGRTRKLRRVLVVVAVVVAALAFACWLPNYLSDRRYPGVPARPEVNFLAGQLPVGSTQAETLAFLRAKGFREIDIRIYVKVEGAPSVYGAGEWTDNPAGGDQIIAQSRPESFTIGPHQPYVRLIFSFDRQGLLADARAMNFWSSLADDDARYTPGKSIVASTPPPAR